MSKRLVVAIDNYEFGCRVTIVVIREDLLEAEAAIEVVEKIWKLSKDDTAEAIRNVEYFVIDDHLWTKVCTKIKWPSAKEFVNRPDSPTRFIQDAIERCKLRVYRACKETKNKENEK